MIPDEIIAKYPHHEIKLTPGQFLFHEGDLAENYFQIRKGEIKVVHYSNNGNEFAQGLFLDGQSLGEPPLIGHFAYPSTAIANKETSMFRMSREVFWELLEDHPELMKKMLTILSKRMYYKATILKEMSSYEPEHRIKTFFEMEFDKRGWDREELQQIPYTRQQIADFIGLRVETVIRTIKRLEEKGELQIKHRSVYYRPLN